MRGPDDGVPAGARALAPCGDFHRSSGGGGMLVGAEIMVGGILQKYSIRRGPAGVFFKLPSSLPLAIGSGSCDSDCSLHSLH
jgi:hypothetical protein